MRSGQGPDNYQPLWRRDRLISSVRAAALLALCCVCICERAPLGQLAQPAASKTKSIPIKISRCNNCSAAPLIMSGRARAHVSRARNFIWLGLRATRRPIKNASFVWPTWIMQSAVALLLQVGEHTKFAKCMHCPRRRCKLYMFALCCLLISDANLFAPEIFYLFNHNHSITELFSRRKSTIVFVDLVTPEKWYNVAIEMIMRLFLGGHPPIPLPPWKYLWQK